MRIVLDTNPSNLLSYPHAETESKTHPQTDPRLLHYAPAIRPTQCDTRRLGTRSALEWIVDQYRVKTDKRSGIVNDPNRADAPRYIVDLIARVITVSLKTVEIVESLPEL